MDNDSEPDDNGTPGIVETGAVARVRPLVAPIVADLGLDIYDLEHRSGVLRLTLDTPIGVAAGPTLDTIALASRLISKELDAVDPIASRYTLEVTSPGVERPLRTADHFRRAVGQQVAVRLADVEAAERRVTGVVVDADDSSVAIAADGAGSDGEPRRIEYRQIDRARTVYEWQAQPKGAAKRPTKNKHEQAQASERQRVSDQKRPAQSATAPGSGPEDVRPMQASERQRVSDQKRPAWPGNAIEGEQS